MLLTKHVKAPRPAAEVRKLHRLLVSLESIDRNAYTVSRAHLGGWSLPGVHWYIARQLPKKVNAFVDMANAVQLSNDAMTNVYLLRTTVNHAVRVARVRRHVHQLLSNRYFIKASLESKALWILECPDAPPLRLLHWSELTKGALPKYQSGDAKSVENLLDDMAHRSAISRSEAEMRNALRFAREKGMEKLSVYQEVLALQQGLYGAQLKLRLQRLAAEESDFAQLGAVHRTAQAHGLEDVARQALAAAEMRLRQALELDMEEALQKCLQLRDEAKACGWSAMEQSVEVQVLRLTMELALLRSELTDDLATIRAVELRARQENLDELAERAARKVNETARKVGEKMGLPAGWDVVERMAGTDAARLLKKELMGEPELVDATFWGWGGHGAKTRTRDRGSEPVAKALKVMSVIYVQNAEVYVNYRARRQEISGSMTPDIPTGDAWDVKTAAIPLVGGRLKDLGGARDV
eukprot:g1357.t1